MARKLLLKFHEIKNTPLSHIVYFVHAINVRNGGCTRQRSNGHAFGYRFSCAYGRIQKAFSQVRANLYYFQIRAGCKRLAFLFLDLNPHPHAFRLVMNTTTIHFDLETREARRGDGSSAFYLSQMYLNGEGIEQDRVVANV